ncbi:phage holin family protein [Enorma sp.]|uniref:phage holin family protein n=1 Tax=Enorma sp. TaxID=1920692 RepID=UPI0025B9BA3F|nr:phage holin family protein [Enorma sp.]
MFQPFPFFIQFTEPELWFIAMALVLSVMDILTGFIGAAIRGQISSTKMREGLGHKMVLVLMIVMAVLLQGFTTHIGDTGWNVPLIMPVCGYIAVMEVASIVENAKDAYPQIADSPLFRLFDNESHDDDEGTA